MGLYQNNNGSLDLLAGSTVYADMPVGTWIKWDDQDNLPTGFLKYGDTITQADYPELYALYGATVPYKADTSELGAIETYTLSLSSASPNVCQYDGFISLGYLGTANSSPQYLTVWVNSSGMYNVHHGNAGQERGMMTIPVKKGDTVYGNNSYDMNSARWYKKSLIVKAKQIALPTDFEDAVDEKIDVVDARIDGITSIEYKTATLATQSNYTFAKWQYTKTGHLCTAYIQVSVSSPASSEILCATGFPKAAQDGANTHFWAFRWDNFNVDPIGMYINHNGQLLIKGGITGGTSPYVVSFTYITTE